MKMSKVIIMAVMLLISISANAMYAVSVDIVTGVDTAYSNADLSLELMANIDLEPDPFILDRIDRVAPIAELRHSARRVQFDANAAKLPNPPSNYRQRYEVGWRG